MTGWQIDLTTYAVPKELVVQGAPPQYDVKGSLRAILVSPVLRLNGVRLLENYELATKIGQADGALTLDRADYNRLKDAFSKIEGLSGAEVELARRVLQAPEIEVVGKEAAPAPAEPQVVGEVTLEALSESIETGKPLEI